MKNKSGDIIYIGKAKNLPKRVKSYFQKNHLEAKLDELVSKIADIEFMVTRNEVEALLLEARLIKQHKPRYNSMLKENVPYMYIKITDEEFPRLVSVRQIEGGGKYFGPFVSAMGRKHLLLTTARLFGIRTNKLTSRSSKELYSLLSEIKARQLENISVEDYQRNVKLAEMFLRGKRKQLVGELEKRMKQASAEENFELAKLYRDQVNSIKIIAEDQLISLPKSYDQDVINFVVVDDVAYFQVFNVSKGIVTSRNKLEIKCQTADVQEVLGDFIQQYYLTRAVPKEVIIPEKIVGQGLVNKYLDELKGQKVVITIPQKGDKKKLLSLVRDNVLSDLIDDPLKTLQARLGLPNLPEAIDGFDISNTAGTEAVGSCVRFRHGQPDKSLYRKFKIKTVIGPNDYAMMKEVISRRYSRSEWSLPDLILVDGGKGQLSVSLRVLKSLKLAIPIISLAKKQEEVFVPGRERSIRLERNSPALKLLQQVRDESHRFAITYHKFLRKKRK